MQTWAAGSVEEFVNLSGGVLKRVDFLVGVVTGEGGTGGGRQAQTSHQGLRTMVTGPDGDPFAVEDGADIVWMSAVDRKGKCPRTRLRGTDDIQTGDGGQPFLGVGHQISFVFLPKHTSWLNQIEIVFCIVTRRVLRPSDFKSTAELKARLLDFIDYFNRTFAKPFRWTYTGRPVAATTVTRPSTWKENWARKDDSRETLALVG